MIDKGIREEEVRNLLLNLESVIGKKGATILKN